MPYLSEEWFEKVEHSVDIASEEGISPWLYDEDRWPSGYAGGSRPREGPGLQGEGADAQVGAGTVRRRPRHR